MSASPRTLIVGTAGHIDHGKSALVRALTGTDPDRLPQEKARGITIDLGFAHLDLGAGLMASFIDVPGHERFVRNMLAGAHGIDAVILVVAADESVMPQTREHFHICRLLGIRAGVIALTKCDAAELELQAIAEMEARELVAGSFLEGAPVLRVSARTGKGLPELVAALRALAETLPAASSGGLLRLPVDRAFVLKGFGTVVTGTLVGGTIAVGEELELLPRGQRVRVRGLQVHGRPAETVAAGSRAAVNLAGIEVAEVRRGDVLARPGTLRPTSMIDADLTLLAGERPLKDQARVRVHLASAEVLARVRLSGAGPVAPGETRRVQLRLESRAVAGLGDRAVIRSYSPAGTIAGAMVVDPMVKKRRRPEALHADPLLGMLAEAGTAGLDAPALAARLTIPLADLSARLRARADVVVTAGDPPHVLSREAREALVEAAREALATFHDTNPLRAAMSREELRTRVSPRAPQSVFEDVVGQLVARREASVAGEGIALATHAVRLSPEEERVRAALVAAAIAAGFEGLDAARVAAAGPPAVAQRMVKVLLAEGLVRRVGDALVHRERLEALKQEVRQRWPPGSRLDVAGVKEITGLSRKFVIPLLEHLDAEKVTRRSGADRIVLG